MREILFRGKTMNGDWVEGSLVNNIWNNSELTGTPGAPCCEIITTANHYDCWYDIIENENIVEVDPSTVGQFTGIIDNNGKRIWEGDIVKIGEDWLFKNEEIAVIEYHQHGIPYIVQRYLKNKPGYGDYNFDYLKDNHDGFYHYYHYYEVIGNIFDNPELLVNHNTTQP